MVSFLALYRGDSVGTAELVAVSADSEIVRRFADDLLSRDRHASGDEVVSTIREAERRGLEIVRDEAEANSRD